MLALSGGQRTIIGEAIANALFIMACDAQGTRGATLVRDESMPALDPEATDVYMRMLRRTGERVGASCTLIVTQNPLVAAACDHTIACGPSAAKPINRAEAA